MKQFFLLLNLSLFIICLMGCSEDSPADLQTKEPSKKSDPENIADLLFTPNNLSDLSVLLSDSETNTKDRGEMALSEFYEGTNQNLNIDLSQKTEMEESSMDDNVTPFEDLPLIAPKDIETETMLSLDKLENDNAVKDATIASLQELNKKLLDEIAFLRELQRVNSPNSLPDGKANEPINSQSDQYNDLKNKLNIQQTQINELLSQNESLEEKVLQLTKNPYAKIRLSAPPSNSVAENTVKLPSKISAFKTSDLHFDAVVTSINGKNNEAFYTEFFLIKEDLESLLIKSEVMLSDYPKIDSYSELWARSRKNPFLYPGIQKKIRTLLLNEVNLGEGKRVRTDIDGAGSINQIESGDYFLVGSAALGKIGVTWNAPINISSGLNKLSLTLANSSWSL